MLWLAKSKLLPPLVVLFIITTIPVSSVWANEPSSKVVAKSKTSFQQSSYQPSNQTVELDDELLVAIVNKTKTSLEIDLDQLPLEIKNKIIKGIILKGGVSKNTPQGLLVKVLNIKITEKVMFLHTRPASLSEAFNKLSIDANVKIGTSAK